MMQIHSRLVIGLNFVAGLTLTACEPKRIEIVKPPVALTECADEPVAPLLGDVDWTNLSEAQRTQRARDEAVLAYVLALRSAWGDCRADVEGIKAWSEGLD